VALSQHAQRAELRRDGAPLLAVPLPLAFLLPDSLGRRRTARRRRMDQPCVQLGGMRTR